MAVSVEMYPDNCLAYELFADMRTQWRIGMGGATGLDYGVMYRMMDRMNLTPDDYNDLEQCVRVMEYTALEVMHEERQANK